MTVITQYLKRTDYQTANHTVPISFLYLWNCCTNAFSNDKALQVIMLFRSWKTLHELWAPHAALQGQGDSKAPLDQELPCATHLPWASNLSFLQTFQRTDEATAIQNNVRSAAYYSLSYRAVPLWSKSLLKGSNWLMCSYAQRETAHGRGEEKSWKQPAHLLLWPTMSFGLMHGSQESFTAQVDWAWMSSMREQKAEPMT